MMLEARTAPLVTTNTRMSPFRHPERSDDSAPSVFTLRPLYIISRGPESEGHLCSNGEVRMHEERHSRADLYLFGSNHAVQPE